MRGLPHVATEPCPCRIVWRLSCVRLLQGRSQEAWKGLGNILLCVTGAEALFADMGHFNARSIRVSWSAIQRAGYFFCASP